MTFLFQNLQNEARYGRYYQKILNNKLGNTWNYQKNFKNNKQIQRIVVPRSATNLTLK